MRVMFWSIYFINNNNDGLVYQHYIQTYEPLILKNDKTKTDTTKSITRAE